MLTCNARFHLTLRSSQYQVTIRFRSVNISWGNGLSPYKQQAAVLNWWQRHEWRPCSPYQRQIVHHEDTIVPLGRGIFRSRKLTAIKIRGTEHSSASSKVLIFSVGFFMPHIVENYGIASFWILCFITRIVLASYECLKSPSNQLHVQQFAQANHRKNESSKLLALYEGNPPVTSQQYGKRFHFVKS